MTQSAVSAHIHSGRSHPPGLKGSEVCKSPATARRPYSKHRNSSATAWPGNCTAESSRRSWRPVWLSTCAWPTRRRIADARQPGTRQAAHRNDSQRAVTTGPCWLIVSETQKTSIPNGP